MTNSKAVPTPSFQIGDLIIYENDGTPIIGVVLQSKGGKLAVGNDRGREIEVPPNRLYPLVGRSTESVSSSTTRLAFLQAHRENALQFEQQQIQLKELWEFVQEDPREYTDRELCELYLGGISDISHLAMRLALLKDRIFFKRSKEGFEPRSEDTVRQLHQSEEQRQEKIQREAAFLDVMKQRSQGRADLPFPDEFKSFITLLEEFAAGGSQSEVGSTREAVELVEKLTKELHINTNIPIEDRAFQILEKVHHFHSDTNLSMIRYKPRDSWPQSLDQDPERFSLLPSYEKRHDLTHLSTFTIDDESTQDMDDALSLEIFPEGFRLGIHISDVASIIPQESDVDREAFLRATSIYLPERTIHMFPTTLSQTALSLREGESRACLSALFSLDSHFRIIHSEVVPSTIRVTKRYTYDEVDILLNKEDLLFDPLSHIASYLEEQRIHNGASAVEKREAIAYPTPEGGFRLVQIDEQSPARKLVGEMMVLYNCCIADYARTHGLPFPYRVQEAPHEESIPDEVPEGPARNYLLRGKLKRSFVQQSPGRHASLGVDAYAQVSSPIRRYLDLACQRQIISHLFEGKPYYSSEELTHLIEDLEISLSRGALVSRESKRYWILRYLQERARSKREITATVLRTGGKNALVELDEVYIPASAPLPSTIKPGAQVTLKISRIDARRDYLRLEV